MDEFRIIQTDPDVVDAATYLESHKIPGEKLTGVHLLKIIFVQALGLTLHDHLIIGRSREVSFRSAGYL